ncbi:MAG: hypothetical protein ACOC2Y_09675 [Spirochaetota bacterium]
MSTLSNRYRRISEGFIEGLAAGVRERLAGRMAGTGGPDANRTELSGADE